LSRNSLRHFLPLFLVSIVFSTASANPLPFSGTTSEDLRFRIEESENRLLVLTGGSLYRFQPDSEGWTLTTQADGLPNPPLRGLSIAEEDIWIFGDGVSFSDARFDDWQRYGSGEGYPGRVVSDVDSDEDYAYAGTDQGAARFDLYILEWEELNGPDGNPLGPVSDVEVGTDYVWFALDGGVAEYRKETESFRVDTSLGALASPKVSGLRQTAGFLWAVTDAGIARYDKDLQTWTSFLPGVELPDARVHQLSQQGEDIWLGTDDGLWRYMSESGIWRRDESNDEMPGGRVFAFELEAGFIWVATDSAFAVYEEAAARWIEYTSSVPLAPDQVEEIKWTGEVLLFLAQDQIVYGLSRGRSNPSLFVYRSKHLLPADVHKEPVAKSRWRPTLDDSGLGWELAPGSSVNIKGGATVFIENDRTGSENGFGDMTSDSRLDLTLSGRFEGDRTLSGFYDSTDPDNSDFQMTYRGARSDVLRVLSAGEIEQVLFNSNLAPGTGLTGGRARLEAGPRTETFRRRLLNADVWAGERRTLPGRDVYVGGNKTVSGELHDVRFIRRQVFGAPPGWAPGDLATAAIYLDDGSSSTNGPNTESRSIAGRAGFWDRLRGNADYTIGPAGRTLILTSSVPEGGALVAVGRSEIDLTDLWERNHYFLAVEPVPGSVTVALRDTTGSTEDGAGRSYMEVFGLDSNGDGALDQERFSLISGILSFPDPFPFPPEVYADDATSAFTIEYSYQANLNIFQLSNDDIVPKSERVTVDRVLQRPDVDYSLLPTSGLFIFFEHVLLDEDSVIEVEYQYEVNTGRTATRDEPVVVAGQIGVAPGDAQYYGANATRWRNDAGADVTTVDVNSRIEWKDEGRLLRITPELAWSDAEVAGGAAPGGTITGGGTGTGGDVSDRAAGVALQGRYRDLEVSASFRNLGAGYQSLEDRRTLLGRLREESNLWSRLSIGRRFQAELEWEKSLSDELNAETKGTSGAADSTSGRDSTTTGFGEVSLLMGTVRILNSGLPNVKLRRGVVLLDTPGGRQEKTISRAELEVSPDQAGVNPFGIQRLWLKTFFQRSDRESDESGAGKRTTDQLFTRFNGTWGSPLSWDLSFQDRRTHAKAGGENTDLRHVQELDATIHSQPHTSFDAFLRWESNRDSFWGLDGARGGFDVRRLILTTFQFYPGRLTPRLSPLSLRLDFGGDNTEKGEPGLSLPGASSLWKSTDQTSLSRSIHNDIVEARVQVVSWMRIVERWERESDRTTREGLSARDRTQRLENRIEMRPSGGVLTFRFITSDMDERGADADKYRLLGQWDQRWGRGILTFMSFETHRTDTWNRRTGERLELWNPLAQITWRRSKWQMDASIGGAMSWSKSADISIGATGDTNETRRQSVTTSLSIHPFKVLSVKLDYALGRSKSESTRSGIRIRDDWEADHDLRLRLQIRV
jgi:hypothetical protein